MKSSCANNKRNLKLADRSSEFLAKQITKQEEHVRSLTKIGVALSSVKNLNHIFDLILNEAISYTNADAATIYKVSEDLKFLDFAIVFTRSKNWRMGGSHGRVTIPSIALYDENGNPQLKYIATNVYHTKRTLVFDDVYQTTDYDISGTKKYDIHNNYRTKSMLTIPLKNHEDDVLGVIQIINAMDENNNIVPFDEEQILMVNSLASQAAIALSNRKLISDLENLLHQFVRSIASAIGRKSKYTNRHIDKVANITKKLSEAIHRDRKLQFKDTHFTKDELKEIALSGWMHDVGKIITPEAVMDKATKLETIVDRIELIKLRYNLFKQALSLYKCQFSEKKLISRFHRRKEFQNIQSFEELIAKLDKEMEFIEKSNTGSEFLPDTNIERIKAFAKLSFTFQGTKYLIITKNELKNLLIRAGTLTNEERKIINDHALVTWEMLSQLKFPKKYKNVALYASSHHEKLNGKGYPQGLTAEQLPLQARIIAIADIFEALTSSDRPYKKTKTLSESLDIMGKMVKFQELDPLIMDFFLDSGLYLTLAKQYLKDDQIDQVDIQSIKKYYHPELN